QCTSTWQSKRTSGKGCRRGGSSTRTDQFWWTVTSQGTSPGVWRADCPGQHSAGPALHLPYHEARCGLHDLRHLASLGIYGVISYSVNQRTQEIGIRMALGASAGDLQMRIVMQTLGLAVIGMSLGAIASWALARTLTG